MTFDAAPDAKPVFKERLLWLLYLAPFFFLLYGSANQIIATYDHVPHFYFEWEKQIPFIPEMILPYMSLDLLFGFSFLFPQTRSELQRHATRLGFSIAISVILFLLLPLQFSFTRPETSGWVTPLFQALQADLPYNQFPSLHITLSIVVGYQYLKHSRSVLRWIYALWFLLIIASILFIYQHHFIDIPGGILIGWLAFYLYPVNGKTRLPLYFVSPKHLGMALKYMLLTIIFTIAAFQVSSLWLLFGWMALSFLLLSIAYATGFNNLSQKKRGRVSWLYLLLFWPYYLANHLTRRYWQHRLPAISKVDDTLYIGMSLNSGNHEALQANNIRTVIDLAPELNSHIPETVDYHTIPLLDLAIPDPHELARIIDTIEQAESKGNVLLHCKLGLSRSVLAAYAWLVKQGTSKTEAWNRLLEIQPASVDRPYMHIALELFEQYADNNRQINTGN